MAVALNGNSERMRILAETMMNIAEQQEVDRLLKTVSQAARMLTMARASCTGAGYVNGKFRVNAVSHIEKNPHDGLGECLNCGICLEIFGHGEKDELFEDKASEFFLGSEPTQEGVLPGKYLKVPLKDDGGKLTGSIIVIDKVQDDSFTQEDDYLLRQLSSIASLALQNIELRAMAASAGIARSRFLANMSHELRTPMNAIMGMTGLALTETIPPAVRDYLQTAKESAAALLSMLDNILDLSRVESGFFELEKTAFNMRAVVEQVVKHLRLPAQKKGLGLVCHLPEDLPDRLIGDPLHFRQILMNLVDNAVKFTSAGKVMVCAEIVEQTADRLCLEFMVSDTGIGIASEDQSRIFSVFTQADASTTRNYGGAGLGLAISRKLVELMDGRIRVESRLNEGSVFRFTIWLRFVQESAVEPPASPYRLASVPERTLHILLAEDTPTNQKVAEYLLTRRGHLVEIAADGRKALELVEQKDFDIVLMDVQMPGMDGFQATAAIRALSDSAKAGIPIVAITAHTLKGDVERCLDAGMDAYIGKPIQVEEFLELVEFLGAPRISIKEKISVSEFQEKEAEELKTSGPPMDIPCAVAVPAFDFSEAVRRCFGKYDFFQDMVDGFLGEADAMLHSMREAFRQGTIGAIQDLAHRLKNTVIYLGAQPAASAIMDVESAAKSGEFEAIAGALDRLDRQLETLKPALLSYRRQDSMTPDSLPH